jgi:peroxiredoxin
MKSKSIKALFISIYITALTLGLIWAGFQLLQSFDWRWVGVVVALLPGLSFFVWLFIGRPARTSEDLPVVRRITLVGAALTVVSGYSGSADIVALVLSMLVGVAGVYTYIYWYSRYGKRVAVELGKMLPPIRLYTTEGKEVGLDQYAGSPMVLMFYRGNWCPLCMAQVKEISAHYKRLAELGVKVALVSPQSHEQTSELAAHFDVQFEFLVDKDNAAARMLGIVDEGGTPAGLEVLGYDSDTVMPTVYVLDGEGKVLFSHLTDNYRVRPEPELFLRVLEEQGAV